MTDQDPTPTLILQILERYPDLIPTTDQDSLIGRMMTYGVRQ